MLHKLSGSRTFATQLNNFKILEQGSIISKLTNRSVISIRGRDATSFLQNLTTQDMRLFSKERPDRAAVMSSFLTPKGRVMFDCIIVKPRLAGQQDEAEVEYWIDVDSDHDAGPLIKHLKKYAIRKSLVINDISHVIKTF